MPMRGSETAAFEAALPAIAEEYGTPCFAYSLDAIGLRIRAVRETLPRPFELSYAVKSNPNPALLRFLAGGTERVEGLDVSSVGELARGLDSGWEPDAIGFTGPAKRDADLRRAVETGVPVVLESLAEARALARIAAEYGRRHDVLVRFAPIRIPPGFGVQLAGRPTQFGIDEEEIGATLPAVLALDALQVLGFHVYSATQGLDATAVAENLTIQAELFRRVADAHGLAPRRLVFGAAFGIPYHAGDRPLDLARVSAAFTGPFEALRRDARCAEARLVLETGRYLVGEAGVYLTRVVRVKRSRGQRIAICDGGMNHHAAAAGNLGSVLHRNFPLARAGGRGDRPVHRYDVVGPLCTTIDRLGHGVELPELDEGDVIIVRSSGAYGLTASPVHFIGHAVPREVFVRTDGGRVSTEDATWLTAPGAG